MGLTTSRSDPPEEVIFHKGCVLSDPYLTHDTSRITPASNLKSQEINQPLYNRCTCEQS
jgi:hypothetical protein